MKSFKMRRLVSALTAFGALTLSSQVMASAFQLWEQDVTNLSNAHAGYAALADNASIAFYNPAGITRFKNQQIVIAGMAGMPNIKYQGTMTANVFNNFANVRTVTAQGGSFGFAPALHYVTPLNDSIGFGFSVDVPFGMKTNYGKTTDLQYVATETSVTVIDISPSVGFKVTEKGSLGFGLDGQRMYGVFNQVGSNGVRTYDSDGINNADDTAYGYHAGALYEFTPQTRAGISYHSQVVHHLSGKSTFTGPLAQFLGVDITSNRATTRMTLPPYTALSVYHRLQPQVAMMGTVTYTQWSTIQNLVLNNVAGLQDTDPSTNISVTVPQRFRNTWSFSLGSDYYVNERATLRAGVGYDQTPAKNAYRNVQMPDNSRFLAAFGGHYQASKRIGVDVGYTHVFVKKAHISPPQQVTGDETTRTNGSVTAGADAIGAQIVWDIA